MRFTFDFTIIFIVLLCAYWMYVIIRSFFNQKNSEVKTKLIRIILVLLFFVIGASVFYGSFIEPQFIKVKTVSLNINKTPITEKIKIAFLTDLHLGPYKQTDYLEKVVAKVIEQQPDLVILGGDFISSEEAEATFLSPLQKISSQFPVLAVMGNHEYTSSRYGDPKQIDKTGLLKKLFADWNIKTLNNKSLTLEIDGATFSVSGIDDLWTGRADLDSIIDHIDPVKTNILISHNPDVALNSKHDYFDLILSGHTHAGQIRLPYIGTLLGVPTILGRNFDHGLFPFGNSLLYISAGLGESGVRARFFNPPELTIINLDL